MYTKDLHFLFLSTIQLMLLYGSLLADMGLSLWIYCQKIDRQIWPIV